MGLETAAIVGGGSALAGLGMQYFENRAARSRSARASKQALDIASAPIPGMINTGQDNFMQYLRANPKALDPFMYDQSAAFKGLQAQDEFTIRDQANKLKASAGSLGSRFGSGFAARESGLRGRYAADISARNAGISQRGFEFGTGMGLQSFTSGQQAEQNRLNLFLQQRAQQLQALGFGASQPYPGIGQQISETGGGLGSLLMLLNYLGRKGGKGGGGRAGGTASGNLVPFYGGGANA